MIQRLQNLSNEGRGVSYAVIAHLLWGAMAPYMKAMAAINPLEIAAHRAFWSIPLGAAVAWRMGMLDKVWAIFHKPKLLGLLTMTSLLVIFNWAIYIWCLTHGHTLDASLGYFINPLMNVAVGYLFLRERFTAAQGFAIGLAVLAVVVVTVGTGVFPWIGLSLAATFCLYGFVRKVIPVGAIEAFVVEVMIAAVPLAVIDYWLGQQGALAFGHGAFNTLMLMGCGAFTTGALIAYAASVRLLRYSTAGLLQYLSPTIVFLTALFAFGEPIDHWKLAGFALIWLALAIYSVAAFREERTTAAA